MKKQYTISSRVFDSLEEVKTQLDYWQNDDCLDENTRVFEIKKEIKWQDKGIILEE